MASVSSIGANFERKMHNRVVISGHGSYRDGDTRVAVPAGKTLYFYVPHGTPLSNAVGMAVEGLDAGTPPPPYEVFNAGDLVYNYILSYPSDLTLNGSRNNAKYDWITIADPKACVPLSVLFKDSRCTQAAQIHWAACRSKANWLAPTHAGYGFKTSVNFAK